MKHHFILSLSVLAASGGPLLAQTAEIEPETLTVEERISEGNHIYVMDMGISGPSAIAVLNADDLSMEGNMGSGTFSQMLMSPGAESLFTGSVYMKRFTRGPIEAVIEEFDPTTLSVKREIVVSDKMAQTLTQRGALNRSADGNYLIVQNATPATSVNIVDLAAGKDLVEVPTPGCWTAYPALEGLAFTTICGDGTMVKYTVSADGTASAPGRSEPMFDADSSPIFGNAVRADGLLVYVSYAGKLLMVDDSGEVPVLSRTVDFAVDDWAPGGYNLMAYHAPSKTLFVMMHSGVSDGSHKAPAEEIWAIDLASDKVVGRSPANGESNIAVSAGETPQLVGVDHLGGVHVYDVTLGETVSLTPGPSREGVAAFAMMIATDY